LVLAKETLPVRRLERKRRRLEEAFFDVIRATDPLAQGITARAPETSVLEPAGTGQETAVTAKEDQ
jgi:hypothetical protein